MSSAPAETKVNLPSTKDDGEATKTDLVVRRRAGLMGLVALASLALSAGYLVAFGRSQDGIALVVGIMLGIVAILHGLAWGDARTPLLVADQTGLRVRLGGDWTGVPWAHVERVEVDDRGRIRDGHVAVIVAEDAEELANARWRSRIGAALNRWFYDASLVVPYGLSTIVTAADVPAALQRLAAGRAPVVRLDDEIDEPEPTVALTTSAVSTSESALDAPEDGAVAPSPGGVTEPPTTPEPEAAPSDDAPARPSRRPRIPLIAAREGAPALPLAKVVAALRSHPARREEVTLPLSNEHLTHGTLALSAYPDEATEPLPEIQQLRRREDIVPPMPTHDEPTSNVGLIIDATTDLSARAMSKVRRAAPLAASTELTADPDRRTTIEDDDLADLVIGATVHDARVRLGLTVDELAERTRIRPYVIESIEVDDFAPCGGDFYARGHLRMLARVLGLDPEALQTTYDDHFASTPINPRAVFDAELSTGSTGMVRGGAKGANWGGLIAAVLVLVLIWGVAKYFADSTELPGTQAPATQNAAGLGSPGPGNTKQPLPQADPKQASVRLTAVGGDSRVVVKDRKGTVVFQGVLADGQAHLSRGLAPLHVMAVNGGVIRLGAPGHKPALMGEVGARSRQAVAASATPAN